MKTTFFIFSFFCSLNLMAQISGPCPCGYAFTIETSKFNFHKPRTDCTSGFGLCIRLKGLRMECYPCYSKDNSRIRMDGDRVYGSVHVSGDQAELLLPLSVLDQSGVTKDEGTFALEDDSIVLDSEDGQEPWRILGGDYPFEIRENLLVIPVRLRQ